MYLNTKSEYSLLNSLIKLDEYIDYALNNDLKYISLCDIDTTFGCYKFIKKAIENNLKPIVGLETLISDQKLYFFAKNNKGLEELYKLNTQILNNEDIKLSNDSQLIIIIGTGVILQQLVHNETSSLDKIREKIDSIYLAFDEDMNNTLLEQIQLISQQYYLKTINMSCKKFLYNTQVKAYETIRAIDANQHNIKHNKHNIKYSYEFRNSISLKDYTLELCQQCNYNIDEIKASAPKYPFTKGNYTDDEYLRGLCFKGLSKRLNGSIDKLYLDRLNYELDIIIDMHFSSYFLIVLDIVRFAKNNKIYVGPGRGSAGGSLVAYCLGITEIDPIKHDLLFERFLNKERLTMPDIDLDFEDARRNEVVDYIINRYGKSRVCKIGTLARFLAKSAFRDVAKVWGIDENTIAYISKSLDYKQSFISNLESDHDLKHVFETREELSELIDIISCIEGLPRQMSIHAAGVIIATDSINHYCAVNSENVSLQEANELEQMGLLKMDILALSNLTFVHQIVDSIKVDNPDFSLDNIPFDDKNTFDLLCSGNTLGIFQLDSQGMRNAITTIKPRNIDEIALVLALYRPGPKEYIKKYRDLERQFAIKNEIDNILASTAGVIVYQEQIMQIAQKVAKYNLNKADILRRGISKKNPELINTMCQDFIIGATNNGYTKDYAQALFNKIQKFAGYGFNKAHAFGYAYLVYQMAYLKANYPMEFYAHLFLYTFRSDKKNDFLTELDYFEIQILPPDLLLSSINVKAEGKKLRLGFVSISGIGYEMANQIVELRQQLHLPISISDVVDKILRPIRFTTQQIKNLVYSGMFDFLGYNRATILYNFNNLLDSENFDITQFGGIIDIKEVVEDDETKCSVEELKAIGINLKYDLFNKYIKQYSKQYQTKIITLDQLPKNYDYKRYNCIINIDRVKIIQTKKGEEMAFIDVLSKTQHSLVLFPKEYKKFGAKINDSLQKYMVVSVEYGEQKLVIKNVF